LQEGTQIPPVAGRREVFGIIIAKLSHINLIFRGPKDVRPKVTKGFNSLITDDQNFTGVIFNHIRDRQVLPQPYASS
jgi:hypothetical protein